MTHSFGEEFLIKLNIHLSYAFVCQVSHNKISPSDRLKQQTLIFSQSGGKKSKIKIPAGLVFQRTLCSACRWAPSYYDLTWSFLFPCALTSSKRTPVNWIWAHSNDPILTTSSWTLIINILSDFKKLKWKRNNDQHSTSETPKDQQS